MTITCEEEGEKDVSRDLTKAEKQHRLESIGVLSRSGL